jgi:hypothetical protein
MAAASKVDLLGELGNVLHASALIQAPKTFVLVAVGPNRRPKGGAFRKALLSGDLDQRHCHTAVTSRRSTYFGDILRNSPLP